jgi:broad specificity phosphatase PhoE
MIAKKIYLIRHGESTSDVKEKYDGIQRKQSIKRSRTGYMPSGTLLIFIVDS